MTSQAGLVNIRIIVSNYEFQSSWVNISIVSNYDYQSYLVNISIVSNYDFLAGLVNISIVSSYDFLAGLDKGGLGLGDSEVKHQWCIGQGSGTAV